MHGYADDNYDEVWLQRIKQLQPKAKTRRRKAGKETRRRKPKVRKEEPQLRYGTSYVKSMERSWRRWKS
ncbi:hypothetical protein RvY_06406-3 [Ramazzottius varieornatus]|uniref:Uncharacterized protein n=1 Tax=Ramazzottius varieornatus TaxID=947166 RepID=A0A1D1UYH5_RAMVA|nr:hypothetical protein RvY_06406-3 [Ramazzottius varieornatus]